MVRRGVVKFRRLDARRQIDLDAELDEGLLFPGVDDIAVMQLGLFDWFAIDKRPISAAHVSHRAGGVRQFQLEMVA